VREVHEPLTCHQRSLLAEIGAVVGGDPSVETVGFHRAREIQQRAARQ
jgi:hypothetical protein